MENNNNVSKIDVRIIVSNLDIAGLVSKAVNSAQLERDYNIIVSSIIPTTDLELAKKVAEGADIILIGGYGQDDNFNLLFNDLKTDFNHIGLFDYNNVLFESEELNTELAQKEILNSIIKSTISYSLNLINIHTLENKLLKLTKNYNNLLDDYNKLIKENEVLANENKDLIDDIDNLKSDFSNFKARFEDIYNKDFLEIYRLDELWQEVFRQDFIDDERIVIATNKFKPDNILVGQLQPYNQIYPIIIKNPNVLYRTITIQGDVLGLNEETCQTFELTQETRPVIVDQKREWDAFLCNGKAKIF